MADIFVSYSSADSDWAKWIAQQLEALGHVPHVHEWEISGGGNIMMWMEERLKKADHVLCVISRAYLAAPYSSWERQAAQWAAATNRSNFALPVFVEDCEASMLFSITKRCDLHGVSGEDACLRLASFMTPAAKPAAPVPFPGAGKLAAAGVRPAVEFPGKPYALANIPITVPRHFVGRDDVLADINTRLASDEGRVAITALHGLRGVGKTTLAAAYADKHRADYRATWWIRAQTEPTMRADLVALGVRLDWVAAEEKEEPALAVVKERLRDDGDRILLIFDNANDPGELRPYLPLGGSTQILVTSNAPNWGGIAAPVRIRVWPKDVGADFFLSRVPGRMNDRAAAEELSAALGGLPLAHEQAAAFCERLGLSFAAYLKRFESAPATLLDAVKDAPAEYHDRLTVAKTFALAIDEAAKLHPAAEPLIVHAALLAPEPIPLFLFSEAREKFGEPLASVLAEDGLDEAVAALRAFALVDREALADERDPTITTDCIRLHRLVRQVAAARRGDELRFALLKAVAAVYPADLYTNAQAWPRARRLDAIALALVEGDMNIFPATAEKMFELAIQLGAYRQYSLSSYDKAQPFFERALTLSEEFFGPEHQNTVVGLAYLAILLETRGELEGARRLYERALSINEKVHGAEHRETVAALTNLSGLLHRQGDWVKARLLGERALSISENVYGPEHVKTASVLFNLAAVQRDQGDWLAARLSYERTLSIREKSLGFEHLETVTASLDFAALLRLEGDLQRARALVERGLTVYEKVLGMEHTNTAIALFTLADILFDQGNAKSAGPLYERSLAICELRLGLGHLNTNRVRSRLAQLYLSTGRPAEAVTLGEAALAAHDQILGRNHNWTRYSAMVTIDALSALGRFDEAGALSERYCVEAAPKPS